jgi:23S rRNA (uracil1939-C5)-methyltransferase
MSRSPAQERAQGPMLTLEIESLDLEGRGIARHDGKVVFVRGALPQEIVQAQLVRRKPRFDLAETHAVLRASPMRTAPVCPHFGVCGGCAMQHVEARAQVSIKQRVLEDTLWHVGRLRPAQMLAPIVGPALGYRYRARLSVRHVPRKGGVLVGFHERGSSYVADMRECHVLPRRVSDLLLPLRDLVGGLSLRDRLPQIEVALGENHLALVLRILQPLQAQDEDLLHEFARRHDVNFWLQTGGPDAILPFGSTDEKALHYALPEFGLRMPFRPTDFTQVNHAINEVLVSRAIGLLEPQPQDRIADLFCGLGNFSLPLATRAREVLGIEGSRSLVERARQGAQGHGLSGRVRFEVANLFELDAARWSALGAFDRILVDPPREGAQALAQVLSAEGVIRPRRMVYVSCNPATLARDAAILVHEGGWTLQQAGVINMFPHTAHVESVAVFQPQD